MHQTSRQSQIEELLLILAEDMGVPTTSCLNTAGSANEAIALVLAGLIIVAELDPNARSGFIQGQRACAAHCLGSIEGGQPALKSHATMQNASASNCSDSCFNGSDTIHMPASSSRSRVPPFSGT